MTAYVKTAPPHIRANDTLSSAGRDTLLALFPAVVTAAFFSPRILASFAIGILCALSAEILAARLYSLKARLYDLHSLSLALLLALLLPQDISLLSAGILQFNAVFFGKMIFGGRGGFPFHPVLLGLAASALCFPSSVEIPLILEKNNWGFLSLAAGGLYLIFRKRIFWEMPALFFLTSLLFRSTQNFQSALLVAAAFYLIPDPEIAPLTCKGRRLLALLAGFAICLAGSSTLQIAILLLMGALSPWMDILLAHEKKSKR